MARKVLRLKHYEAEQLRKALHSAIYYEEYTMDCYRTQYPKNRRPENMAKVVPKEYRGEITKSRNRIRRWQELLKKLEAA